MTALTYPSAKTVAQVDDYHGTKVADPYRWLEDLDSADTRAWIEAENKLTFDYLGRIPGRDQLKQRLTQLWNYERYSSPEHYGDHYFYTRNDGLQNQAVLYVADSLDATPRCCWIRTPCRPTARSRSRPGQSATMARIWPTGCRRAVRTGRNGTCSTWPPARTPTTI